jgi:NAD(P)-dependent dehydrogenase (short-subunit alcohol dehydrogenase family)
MTPPSTLLILRRLSLGPAVFGRLNWKGISMGMLTGKRAFITGAGGGIGAAIGSMFAAQGATVALADINGPLVAETASRIPGAHAVVVDVANRQALAAAIDGFAGGGLDIMVNNAVKFHYALLTDMEEDVVEQMIDTGLKGALWSIQAATPHLVANGGGSVINLSSMALAIAVRHTAVYTAIKGAIDALTRQQAVELAVQGIRVNALAPGTVPTPATSARLDEAGWELRRTRSPIRRVVSDTDVAAAATFLASDQALSITGVTLKIDGAVTIAGAQ